MEVEVEVEMFEAVASRHRGAGGLAEVLYFPFTENLQNTHAVQHFVNERRYRRTPEARDTHTSFVVRVELPVMNPGVLPDNP
jgi:hypothetical protein